MMENPKKLFHSLCAGAKLRLDAIDPRRVRLRDPRSHVRRSIAIVVIAAVLLAGAVAVAASASRPETGEVTTRSAEPSDTSKPPSKPVPVASAPAAAPAADERHLATPAVRHARFHDPYYVFTEGPVAEVKAYPLADPPGLVVNLIGVPEPTAAPQEMVGADTRISAIRRRTTAQGVRYVLRVTTPIRRIEVTSEGNVVIIAPTR